MDFYVYRLNYATRKAFEKAMLDKGVLVQDENGIHKGKNTLSIVELGFPVKTLATYDENGNELTPSVLHDKFHADIKTLNELTFPSTIAPKIDTPFHGVKWAKGAKNL